MDEELIEIPYPGPAVKRRLPVAAHPAGVVPEGGCGVEVGRVVVDKAALARLGALGNDRFGVVAAKPSWSRGDWIP